MWELKQNTTGRKTLYRHCCPGASWRPGGAGLSRVRPPAGFPAGGGAARQGQAAEAEGGEAPAAGGGAHSDHGADQPAGEHRRPAPPQTAGGGEPRAAEGERTNSTQEEL